MSPEEGGGWFFLLVESSAQKRLIIDSEKAKALLDAGIIDKLKSDGIFIISDEDGAWKAFDFIEALCPI